MLLGRRTGRVSLQEYGVKPGVYSRRDLSARGMYVPSNVRYSFLCFSSSLHIPFHRPKEIPQINPNNACDYNFYQSDESGERSVLGCDAALEYLQRQGCSLATPDWVRNHWSLVLWKRASTICCKPEDLESMWTFEGICEGLRHQ